MRAVAGILLALSLFGLMFGAGPELALWFKSRSWQPAEATLLNVVAAAKSPQGVTDVHYRYEARGGLHESNRVFLSHRWMPGGEVLAQLETRFLMAQQQSRVMRLWVSPDDPGDAVFVRDLNWDAMLPLLGGTGLGMLLGLTGLFWPARAEGAENAAEGSAKTMTQVSTAAALPKSSAPLTSAHAYALTVNRADGELCVEFQAKPGTLERVESATLDRIDQQGIVRWQDALPLNVLANKTYWHVRCTLPRKGMALAQAREHVVDTWQVTFKVKTESKVKAESGASRVSQALPAQWWEKG